MRPRNVIRLGSLLALVALATFPAYAEDKKDSKEATAVVDGTWKWSFTTQDGQKRESVLKLKRDGEKVTGTVTGRQGNETEIKDGKFDPADATLSFTVTRERDGTTTTMKYTGKVEGDTIKGKIASTRGDGQTRERDWEAAREKDEVKKDSSAPN
jgi:hypothetical protein